MIHSSSRTGKPSQQRHKSNCDCSSASDNRIPKISSGRIERISLFKTPFLSLKSLHYECLIIFLSLTLIRQNKVFVPSFIETNFSLPVQGPLQNGDFRRSVGAGAGSGRPTSSNTHGRPIRSGKLKYW